MKFKLTVENNVIEQLQTHKCSILVSIYQIRKFVFFSFNNDQLINQEGLFEELIGIAILGEQLVVQLICTKNNPIIYSENHLNLTQKPPYKVFSPGVSYVHSAASLTEEANNPNNTFYKLNLFELNLHFSCLSYCDFNDSFILVWKPIFINYFSDDNYYYLNDIAFINDESAYHAALGKTNKILLGKYG
jgi:hypothetical protein